MFPGMGWRVMGSTSGVRGSSEEKSPVRCAAVGMIAVLAPLTLCG